MIPIILPQGDQCSLQTLLLHGHIVNLRADRVAIVSLYFNRHKSPAELSCDVMQLRKAHQN